MLFRSWYHALLGDHEQALACCEQAVTLQREIGNRNDLPSTLDSLGLAYHNLGRHGEAAASYQRAVDLYCESGDRFHEADTLIHLGDAYEGAGATGLARTAWRRALSILDDLRHPAAERLRPRCEVAG